MVDTMLMAYATVAVFALVAVAFVLGSMIAGKLLRPHRPEGQKLEVYECGEAPETQAWFNFNPRFYVVALVFLIFDVEIAFLYPVATVFKRYVAQGLGAYAALEIFAFVAVLLLGLAYVWRKGDLEWVRTLRPASTGAASEGMRLVVSKSLAGEAASAPQRLTEKPVVEKAEEPTEQPTP
jgi:NADH-quinone oxidoreductase subunit A